MSIELVEIQESDLSEVKEIYDHYIQHSTATFHTELISIQELKDIIPIGQKKYRSFLIKKGLDTCGYCYFSPFKKRQAYNRTAEITVYLKPDFYSQGIGSKAETSLVKIARSKGIYELLAVISGDNMGSIDFFKKQGYSKCAHFEKVGEKFGRLLDVLVYQKSL